jgi:hypothetical protein
MLMGPGPRFELGRKAPQASMLPSYTTPATFPCKTCTSATLPSFMLGFDTDIANPLFSFAEDFLTIIISSYVLKIPRQKIAWVRYDYIQHAVRVLNYPDFSDHGFETFKT